MRDADRQRELQAQIHYRLVEELTSSNQRLNDLVQQLDAIVLQVHSDGSTRLSFLNPAWERTLGFPVESSLGRPLTDFVRGDDARRLRSLLGSTSCMIQREMRFRTRDGGARSLRVALKRERFGQGWSGSLHDVTELREAEEHLQRAKTSAEEASRAKTLFLANTSHEIRTPLTALLGYANLMGKPGYSSADCDRFREAIRHNAEALLQLVDDVLDITKIEAGELVSSESVISPLTLMRSACRRFEDEAAAKGLRLELEVKDRVEAVRVDGVRVTQIITNLLSNAIKHTDAGSVRLLAECRPGSRPGEVVLAVQVSDTGEGIPDEQLDRIFRPFARVKTRRLRSGTGLGLAIVHRLTVFLGGEISVASTPEVGTTFTLTLPVEEADPPRPEECGGLDGESPLAGVRALVVDDNEFSREISRAYLEEMGATVDEAVGGEQALDRVLAPSPVDYEIVLMDMQMPGVDGYEATRRLRRRGYAGPVVALTAHALRGDREECLAAGCDDYLSKPITPERLVEAVHRALQGGRGGAPPAQDRRRALVAAPAKPRPGAAARGSSR